MPEWVKAFDVYPKTLDDLKERTLSGGLLSLCVGLLACLLLASELREYVAVETVDKLDVDTTSYKHNSHRHQKFMPINLDILLPSLPCDELVTTVVDETGLQQLSVTDTLQKLRVDRHGTPMDIPKPVVWHEAIAPAFTQRKVLSLMEEARAQHHMASSLCTTQGSRLCIT